MTGPSEREPRGDESSGDPEQVFAAYLAASGRGEAPDFAAWCAEHEEIREDLENLHADWLRVEGLLERLGATQTLSERIESILGGADPAVTLDEDPGAPPVVPGLPGGPPGTQHSESLRSGPSAERIERLASYSAPENRYAKRNEIGRGGMGAIYRVWDQDLRRPLAMKLILGQKEFLGETERAHLEPHKLTRFLEEAQITSQLDHPGIVPVHELGIDLHGRAYFTMRLVRGKNLREIIEYVHTPELAAEDGVDEEWTLARALRVVLQVAEAMSYAHSKNVVHRDLKPSNIMVGRFGETYVMDWGLAKVKGRPDARNIRIREDESQGSQSEVRTDRLVEESQPDTEAPIVTMDGDVVGTPVYMSPEQARGRVDEVDEQSDVYGLGSMLYHLLTNERPFIPRGQRASPHRVLTDLRKGPPTPITKLAPEVPAELVAICEKAMARRKADRYASMLAVASDLRAFLEGRVVAAYESGALAEFRKWVRRNRSLAASVAAGLLAIILGLAGIGLSQARGREVAELERNKADLARRDAEDAETRATEAYAKLVALSEVRHAKTLLDREFHELWPVHPERIPDFERWLVGARVIRERLPDYREELARLRARAAAPTRLDLALEESAKQPISLELREHRKILETLEGLIAQSGQPLASWLEQRDTVAQLAAQTEARIAERTIWRFTSAEDGARHDLLHEAVSFAEELEDSISNVSWRLSVARSLERDTLSGLVARERWTTALADIASDERYAGVQLEPGLGLLPLWRNPQSELWEFVWLPSGTAPTLDSDSGRVLLEDASGIVLVLVPPGSFRLGCDLPDGTHRQGDPYVDPGCRSAFFEGPSQAVTLDAFFLAKFETTQGQWLRVMGTNPSQYGPDNPVEEDPTTYTLVHPVERVSWNEARQFSARSGLELPNEARWEYAARAGSTGVFWCGNEAADLVGRENVADMDLGALDPNFSLSYGNVEALRDGFAYTAPVGALEPNAFGLHDMAGNLHEWCREHDFLASAKVRDGDGFRVQEDTAYRLVKGGSFSQLAQSARSAFHAGVPPEERWESIGVRLFLPLVPTE